MRLQCKQLFTPCVASRTIHGHQNRVCMRYNVRVRPLCPANGDVWHAMKTSCLSRWGTTRRRSCRMSRILL